MENRWNDSYLTFSEHLQNWWYHKNLVSLWKFYKKNSVVNRHNRFARHLLTRKWVIPVVSKTGLSLGMF